MTTWVQIHALHRKDKDKVLKSGRCLLYFMQTAQGDSNLNDVFTTRGILLGAIITAFDNYLWPPILKKYLISSSKTLWSQSR